MRTGVVNVEDIAPVDLRKHPVDGEFIVVLAERAGNIVFVIARSRFLAHHGDVMIGAVHRRTHQVRRAGIDADVILVCVFFMNRGRDQCAVRAEHKASHLSVNGNIVHAGRNENLIIDTTYTVGDFINIVRRILRTIRDSDAAGEIDKVEMTSRQLADFTNKGKKRLRKSRIIFVCYGIAYKEGMNSEMLRSLCLQPPIGLDDLRLGHTVFCIAWIVHDAIGNLIDSARIIAAGNRLRDIAEGLFHVVNMCDVIEVDDAAELRTVCKFLVRRIIRGEHDVVSGKAAGVRKHQLRLRRAVHTAAVFLKNLHQIRIRCSLNRKILPKARVPGKGVKDCLSVSSNPCLIVNMKWRWHLPDDLFKLFLCDKWFFFHNQLISFPRRQRMVRSHSPGRIVSKFRRTGVKILRNYSEPPVVLSSYDKMKKKSKENGGVFMWADSSVFYQIYPIGMCGAPYVHDDIPAHRIKKVIDWIPHLTKLGIDAVYFSPVFESDAHGYDTRDYRKIDTRLGTNADFAEVVKKMHEAGIKVIIDGVFNHVGRGFFGFCDVLKNRENSRFRDWFYLNFDGNTSYNDGFGYEGWEGCMDLVKLNLQNPEVSDYLIDSVHGWIDTFDIDGLRLDVAYMVDREFLKRLRRETSQWKDDFFLLGEILGGDYRTIMNAEMCHSATNYECYKGIYSALNSDNLFEIVHSLLRQFGPEEWTLYKGCHPVSFVDNHDVSRIATILKDERLLAPAYAIMYTMPGIPMVYYGSEWGIPGDKKSPEGDRALRPAVDRPQWNHLTDTVAALSEIRHTHAALSYGDFSSLLLENRHCVFSRAFAGGQAGGSLSPACRFPKDEEGSLLPDRVITAINEDDGVYTAHFDACSEFLTDLLTGERLRTADGIRMEPYSARVLVPAELS